MRRVREHWQRLRLNVKFIVILVVLVWIPTIAVAVLFFQNELAGFCKEEKAAMELELQESYAQMVKHVESVNMSAQFFLNDSALLGFLESVSSGTQMGTAELRRFYTEDIASLERLINSNPYLYQIRVYADSDTMQEMMPVLYRQSRMLKLSWAQEDSPEGWHFDYSDVLFDSWISGEEPQIASYVTAIESYGYGKIGILEVAIQMDTLFPELYDQSEDKWHCFVDENGIIYLGDADSEEHRAQIKALQAAWAWDDPQENEKTQVLNLELDGNQVLVGCFAAKGLSGQWMAVYDLSENMAALTRARNLTIALSLMVLLLLTLLVNWIVKRILKGFYGVLGTIREVQGGNLSARATLISPDETGELAGQVNTMLDHINRLMEENLQRELLAKNTEIKSLQNQINAHFIYNVLESVKMMAEIEEKYEISDAITRLGRLLRYSMRWTSGNVTVLEEMEYIRNYVALMNLRFDYEIYLSENLPEAVLDQQIPKMTLQPIVENAIIHGIEQMAEDTNIYIKGMLQEGDCVIEITDAGCGMSEERLAWLQSRIAEGIETAGSGDSGIGLKNVQDRIRMSFGASYGIQVASRLGCYTKVRIRIPVTCRELCGG